MRAAFLDRDGTLNTRPPQHDYVREVSGFAWIPGAREGMAMLAEHGFALIVVSNQRGVSRGMVSPQVLTGIEQRIAADLEPLGVTMTGFLYCTHGLDDGCDCRKPAPGMLLRAADEHGIDLAASWMIGDADSDVAAGRGAGCRTARVGPDPTAGEADIVAPDLLTAAREIVSQ